MPRTNLRGQSVPSIELDQRSREARIRLERIERLLVSRAGASVELAEAALAKHLRIKTRRGYHRMAPRLTVA
jgi:hypothetical protein